MYGEETFIWPGCPSRAVLSCTNLVMSAAVVNRLGKKRTIPLPDTVAGAQGQGMGASRARSS